MVTFRTLSLALLAMAVEVFIPAWQAAAEDAAVGTGSGSRADMSVTAEVIGGTSADRSR